MYKKCWHFLKIFIIIVNDILVQWHLLVFLTEMSRVWNSFPLNSTPQPPFNVSKKIFIMIDKAKLIVQVKFYFPLNKPVKYDAGLRMTSIFLAYLRSCGKKVQAVNASPSSCTWGKLFLSYARALHCHHGQVKERSVLSSSSSFFFSLFSSPFNFMFLWSGNWLPMVLTKWSSHSPFLVTKWYGVHSQVQSHKNLKRKKKMFPIFVRSLLVCCSQP